MRKNTPQVPTQHLSRQPQTVCRRPTSHLHSSPRALWLTLEVRPRKLGAPNRRCGPQEFAPSSTCHIIHVSMDLKGKSTPETIVFTQVACECSLQPNLIHNFLHLHTSGFVGITLPYSGYIPNMDDLGTASKFYHGIPAWPAWI